MFSNCIYFSYMTSAFFTKATIGSVSSAIIFLMTFMPYIVIVSVGSSLTTATKIVMVCDSIIHS